MNLQNRITLLLKLRTYLLENSEEWQNIKLKASIHNGWFNIEFIDIAVQNIVTQFLAEDKLSEWLTYYQIDDNIVPKNVGIVMAGNIPMVGFHDFLCVFMSGHQAVIKTSSKDELLIKHLIKKLYEWEVTIQNNISFAERLNGCDAYIATGSNNSGRYFEYYFGRYPHIIRRNRTSVAILDTTETPVELEALADDIQLYFGLGCRNVTQLYVPKDYDFIPLLNALRKYEHFMDFHKYKHNFDYHLALLIMGNRYYMNNDTVILTENTSPFSPVSQVHYGFYEEKQQVINSLQNNPDIQCVTGHGFIPFGMAQSPSLMDYADGVDTMAFLTGL